MSPEQSMFYLLKIKKSVCATMLSENSGIGVGPGVQFQTRLTFSSSRSVTWLGLSCLQSSPWSSWLQLPAISRSWLMRKDTGSITSPLDLIRQHALRCNWFIPQRTSQHVRYPRTLQLLVTTLLIHLLSPEFTDTRTISFSLILYGKLNTELNNSF